MVPIQLINSNNTLKKRSLTHNSCRGETSMVMETKNPVPYLPHELIIQILLRLPVKSLIRFKCVCKSWFSLISHTHFANSHFQQLTTHSSHIHRLLFISDSPPETRSIDTETSLDSNDSVFASLNPNFIPSGAYSRIEIKGSCRGFIVLQCCSSYYLWNPSTGVHQKVPFSPLGFNSNAEYCYGFGYDQLTDDYLLVSFSLDIPPQLFEFFSFRGNTWKNIDLASTAYIFYMNAVGGDPKVGLFFSGAIHWFAYCNILEMSVIVVFDLMERKLLDIRLPDKFDGVLDYCGLWVYRDFLSLWTTNFDDNTIEIWVMKEYKVHSSWTKTHVLSLDAIPTKDFFPLCSTKSGDIVGTDDHTRMVKYNGEGHLLGHLSYRNVPCPSLAVMYTESLLSLPEENVQA